MWTPCLSFRHFWDPTEGSGAIRPQGLLERPLLSRCLSRSYTNKTQTKGSGFHAGFKEECDLRDQTTTVLEVSGSLERRETARRRISWTSPSCAAFTVLSSRKPGPPWAMGLGAAPGEAESECPRPGEPLAASFRLHGRTKMGWRLRVCTKSFGAPIV